MRYTKLCRLLNNFLLFLLRCRIHVGRRPACVSAPAIIFFPLLPDRLNCGLAGLMTCRSTEPSPASAAGATLVDLWQKVKSAGLKAVGAPGSQAADYAGSQDSLDALTAAILSLKAEEAQKDLFFQAGRAETLAALADEMAAFLADEEKNLEVQAAILSSTDLETIHSRLIQLKDNHWMLERDILSNLKKIASLGGVKTPAELMPAAFGKYRKLNLLLNALDRLEVRGRDSAGIALAFVLGSEEALREIEQHISAAALADDFRRRTQTGDLRDASISLSRRAGKIHIAFTYKTYSIVGELGRNVAALRRAIENDALLKLFAGADTAAEIALTHTRWASVGSITEENCHPVNNHTCASLPAANGEKPQISVVLNGDIDNYAALRQALESGRDLIAPTVTTDTKIIPLQIEKYLEGGRTLAEAFRLAVNDFEGSHAIAMHSSLEPGKMFLALRGSGQSLYVGVAPDQYLFSSELYGLVEVMPRFVKMNGEAQNGSAAGQIFILDSQRGGLGGIDAFSYDGKKIALADEAVQTAEITTRDIDRGGFPHFFLKEISEAALSVRRTLRGKYRIAADGSSSVGVQFNLGADMVPDTVRAGLQDGRIRHIIVIGHGTAAVAGQAVADALSQRLKGTGIAVTARIASELSGFGLHEDLSDTLVIPITQSGTTTDTNRAVAMAREHGAFILAIVNRRQSDITAKAHGVFYTSDGRDIEMSVASTKAFYAQIVAGQILALCFAKLTRALSDDAIAVQLRHLETAPRLMNRIVARRDAIAAAVKKAAEKRYWAVVGSGPNKAAADEIRIKLSELCYKTISSDIVENKKHIDLSAEPLILVCAAGNPEEVLEDIAKDVAIFKAHKSTVIVFADDGDGRFDGTADTVIALPRAPSPLPVIFNTMAGHLWGYFAAQAIDEEAQFLRKFRGHLAEELRQRKEQRLSVFDIIADPSLGGTINAFYALFNERRQSGAFGALKGKTLSDLLLLMKYTAGKLPLQDIRQDFRDEKDLLSPFDLLDVTLGAAIDELSRPIDAIRHQAKTVTVGTSRKEKEAAGLIFDLMGALNITLKHLSYRDIRMISRIQPAFTAVRGYTVYDIHGLDAQGHPTEQSTIAVSAKGGAATYMKSRADQPTALMGVKRTIVSTGHAYLGRGKTDGSPILIVPFRTEGPEISHLLLIHVDYNEALGLPQKIAVLGYRYSDIRNLIDEYNLIWTDRYLEAFSLEFLFSEAVEVIAGRIKAQVVRREEAPSGKAPDAL